MNIKQIVQDNEVSFVRYRQGVAYYSGRVPTEAARLPKEPESWSSGS